MADATHSARPCGAYSAAGRCSTSVVVVIWSSGCSSMPDVNTDSQILLAARRARAEPSGALVPGAERRVVRSRRRDLGDEVTAPAEVAADVLDAPLGPDLPPLRRREQRSVHHEEVDEIRVCGDDLGADAEAVPAEEDDLVAADGRDHRGEVVAPLLEDRAVPVDDRVRQPDAATVEHDDVAERAQPVEHASDPGLVLEELHRDEPARHHDDGPPVVTLPLGLEHPVREVRAVLGLCELDVAHRRESRALATPARCRRCRRS